MLLPNFHLGKPRSAMDFQVISSLHACVLSTCSSLHASCLTLWDPMDCSLPGSSVHRILLARILEWVAISSSKGSSRPKDQTVTSGVYCFGRWILLPLSHLGALFSLQTDSIEPPSRDQRPSGSPRRGRCRERPPD